MNKFIFCFLLVISSCSTGNLTVITELPMELKEASGITISSNQNILWIINDSDNKPILYGVNKKGKIKKTLNIKAKNRDWEDLTTDLKGTIYIGNFGNNANDSKALSILKVSKDSLNLSKKIPVEKIKFKYPEQKKFPPKNKNMHFDCEAFFHFNDSLYLFTKSRNPDKKGKTNLYGLPAKPGSYKAQYKASFNTCNKRGCWVTSAAINKTGDKMALLTENSVFVFSNFKGSHFFNGNVKEYSFAYSSQKESVCFKNDSILYITDEYIGISGGNLYEFNLD